MWATEKDLSKAAQSVSRRARSRQDSGRPNQCFWQHKLSAQHSTLPSLHCPHSEYLLSPSHGLDPLRHPFMRPSVCRRSTVSREGER